MIRRLNKPGRNEPCICGSGLKFKKCCGGTQGVARPHTPKVVYIDDGEEAVRWVICDHKGTSFFSDKDDRILVFTDKAVAFAIAGLGEFASQEDGEINVAGVGPTKFTHLCEKLPYIEIDNIDTAVALVRERIEFKSQERVIPEQPIQEEDTNAGS